VLHHSSIWALPEAPNIVFAAINWHRLQPPTAENKIERAATEALCFLYQTFYFCRYSLHHATETAQLSSAQLSSAQLSSAQLSSAQQHIEIYNYILTKQLWHSICLILCGLHFLH
jgi:hypothetical protein